MAKKKKVSKVSKAASKNIAFASLLAQLQDRVTNLSSEVSRAWQLGNSREAVASKNREAVEKYAADTTASLYALRNSTQTGFSQVARDIERLQNSINDKDRRILSLEQQVAAIRTAVFAVADNSILGRLNILEAPKVKKTKRKKNR